VLLHTVTAVVHVRNSCTLIMHLTIRCVRSCSDRAPCNAPCTALCTSLQVLTLNGYGREADIWSVGTIMYLLMRGRLPFDGDSREEIIERTINGSIDTDDEIWRTYSAEAKDLLLGLLNKVHHIHL
jgi:serine/threonine protein kinase